ncbi:MAG: hypothetical protein SGPRY_007761, partial [Prymnesium sp.]
MAVPRCHAHLGLGLRIADDGRASFSICQGAEQARLCCSPSTELHSAAPATDSAPSQPQLTPQSAAALPQDDSSLCPTNEGVHALPLAPAGSTSSPATAPASVSAPTASARMMSKLSKAGPRPARMTSTMPKPAGLTGTTPAAHVEVSSVAKVPASGDKGEGGVGKPDAERSKKRSDAKRPTS